LSTVSFKRKKLSKLNFHDLLLVDWWIRGKIEERQGKEKETDKKVGRIRELIRGNETVTKFFEGKRGDVWGHPDSTRFS